MLASALAADGSIGGVSTAPTVEPPTDRRHGFADTSEELRCDPTIGAALNVLQSISSDRRDGIVDRRRPFAFVATAPSASSAPERQFTWMYGISISPGCSGRDVLDTGRRRGSLKGV